MKKFFFSSLIITAVLVMSGCTSPANNSAKTSPPPSAENTTFSSSQNHQNATANPPSTQNTISGKSVSTENSATSANTSNTAQATYPLYYTNGPLSFSMNALDDYVVTQIQHPDDSIKDNSEIGHILLDSLSGIKSLQASTIEDYDGPAEIYISFYKNPEKLDAKTWTLKNYETYKPEEDKKKRELYINGKKAFFFTGQGIGEMNNYALGIDEYMVVLSGEEPLLDDFNTMAKTVKLELKK